MIEFRNLRPDELTRWFDFLCRDIFPHDPREAVESMWNGNDEHAFEGVFIAVQPDGHIIGSVMAGCRNMSVLGTPIRTGIISGVGVAAEFRGQGISAQLFALCNAYMLSRDAKIAHLYSKPDTLAYYTKQGYLSLPRQPGEDFFRMYRVLSPFTLGDTPIADTSSLIRFLQK